MPSFLFSGPRFIRFQGVFLPKFKNLDLFCRINDIIYRVYCVADNAEKFVLCRAILIHGDTAFTEHNMTKDSNNKKPGKAFTIDLPEGVKKSLPKDFDIGDIGNIDLVEAEAIANENVLLLNENDLIEGLEDFDLIPLKESARVREETAAREAAAPVTAETAVMTVEREEEEEAVAGPVTGLPEETAPVSEKTEARKHEEEFDDGRTWIPLDEIDTIDEHGKRWVPLHKLPVEEHRREEVPAEPGETIEVESITPEQAREEQAVVLKEEEPAGIGLKKVLSLDDLVEPDVPEKAHAGVTGPEIEPVVEVEVEREARPAIEKKTGPQKPAVIPEGHVDENEEYMIWDMPDSEAVIAEPVVKKEDREVPAEKPAVEKEKPAATTEEKVEAEAPRHKPAFEHETPAPARVKDIPLAVLRKPEKPFGDDMVPPVSDVMTAGQVLFIDDKQSNVDIAAEGIFDENRLEKIITGIVQVDEGASYLLREANAEEDRERIATISDELRPEYEEMFEDLDYKYSDEEMDYIHTAIVEEDYSSYIREIDEFFGTRGGRTVSARLELLGLTADEFDSIEDLLFKEEFKDVNLYDQYHLYEFDRAGRTGGREDRQYRYLLPAEESLIDIERDSIESDVSSSSALIFEEDVQHIKEQLKKRTGKTDVEVVELVERAFKDEEIGEEPRTEAPLVQKTPEEPLPAEPMRVEEAAPVPAAAEQYFDITDRVVILEDQADVERFVKTFPEPKQVNIKMLLKYLDGLFERLPEDIIRKFASSDYFNLYLKVLNELGV